MNITEAGNTLVLTDASEEEKARIRSAIEQPNEPDKMLTRIQVAERLQVHPGSVKRFDRQGILHPIRVTSRVIRYSSAEVTALLKYRGAA